LTKPPGKGLAIASIVCGALGVFTCGMLGFVGLILGLFALIRSGPPPHSAKSLAVLGLTVSLLAGIGTMSFIWAFQEELQFWILDFWRICFPLETEVPGDSDANDFFREPTEQGAPLPLRLCPAAHHRRCADAFSP
jgi:hypothetical protein